MSQHQAARVFSLFSEIAKIPHGSGNTGALAAFCLRFARDRGLEVRQDSYGNVVIRKAGAQGRESEPPVILQGHLDMVCAKDPDCTLDMERQGIVLENDGACLSARGTTLGGDNGIAVAMILALLEDTGTISHPPLEALLTADEETGMLGAKALDASLLTGRRLINLDSGPDNALVVSCAGGARVVCTLPLTPEEPGPDRTAWRITLTGLLGGHSGNEIGHGRRNAARTLADFLCQLALSAEFRLADFRVEGVLNAIPARGEVLICLRPQEQEALAACAADFDAKLKQSCAETEPQAALAFQPAPPPSFCLDRETSLRAARLLFLAPCGVLAMSPNAPFLPETSSNLGNVSMDAQALTARFMIRSNTAHGQAELLRQFGCLTEALGGVMVQEDSYPAWEYRRVSPLRETMARVYAGLYGEQPQIQMIHAGLECGILGEKLGHPDMVSTGVNLYDVHTPAERLDIQSAQKCWDYLLETLRQL